MKKFLSTFLATLLVLTFATSCGKKSEKAKLKLYNWGDYLSPSVVKKFEKEFNCQVIQETFDSNEAMYAKIKAGATQFDVLVPSCYMVNIMVKQDMLLKLDKTLLPNVLKSTFPVFAIYAIEPIVAVPAASVVAAATADFLLEFSVFG